VSDVFAQPDKASTPLTEENKRGLKLTYIATRDELNLAEQENIVRGQNWALARRRTKGVDESFVTNLHRHMFGDVWNWAGKYRTHEVNLGIDSWDVPAQMHVLLDDVAFWIENKTYSPDETAVRFHHRLTQIHPFPNGNGRHARLMADLLIMQLGGERFTWGQKALHETSELRNRYVAALKAADNHDMDPLLSFARS